MICWKEFRFGRLGTMKARTVVLSGPALGVGMRTATLKLHGSMTVVEFRIVAFEQGGVSAWPIQDGHATGHNINFGGSEAANPDDAIRNAASALMRLHPDVQSELTIDP
jgi:hypothetical protein